MEKFLKNSRFFYILTLICLTGFLVLPNICLADDFENITIEEIGKYLELPEDKVENLLDSLCIYLILNGWIWKSYRLFNDEERAVPCIMREAVRIQALNHLLIDAPIQVSWAIIKNATKIAKLFLTQDPSGILNELEKESVEKAVAYGINFLFGNEIRMTPGAIELKYESRNREEKKLFFNT